MNVAMILAMLLNSGVCAKSDFHSPDGGTLRVVVCPIVAPSEPPADEAPPAPPPEPKPEPKKDERQA